MSNTCATTGQSFTISAAEQELRQKLKVEEAPTEHPMVRLLRLAAFWPHWALYKRTCDKTGQSVISTYAADCPYPVWQRDEWLKHAAPPAAQPDLSQPVFPQLWSLFQQCPIPHNIGSNCDNCDYTDDWWDSKSCYLSHSGTECEDAYYCYRAIRLKNVQYGVFSTDADVSCDLTNCFKCFQVRTALNSRDCVSSAFLYDCRNCSNCFLCSNLRNKEYYFQNQPLPKEQWEEAVRQWQLHTRTGYERAKQAFAQMLQTQAWHRALSIDQSENVTGNYINNCKDMTDCFFVNDMESCAHVLRGAINVKDCLDCVSPAFKTELCYQTVLVQDTCYDNQFCCELMQSKAMRYCMRCFQCEECFGCCGLVGKRFHIFNQPYPEAQYRDLVAKLTEHMRQTGEWGQFFPGHFAPNPYENSLAGLYWPLDAAGLQRFGMRASTDDRTRPDGLLDAGAVPDDPNACQPDQLTSAFWDDVTKRPFRIEAADLAFSQQLQVPLMDRYYMRRIQDNFRFLPFSGSLRAVQCAKCQAATQTGWPAEYDSRILCEQCYLAAVY